MVFGLKEIKNIEYLFIHIKSRTISLSSPNLTYRFCLDDNEDNAFWSFNDEPILINGNGNKCIWKQDSNQWLIGNCDELGVNKGFAHMKDCKCPWPR